jgi:hypothetical protein
MAVTESRPAHHDGEARDLVCPAGISKRVTR